MKLDFKSYYESKLKLLEAVDSSPRVKLQYKLTKYCKVPLHETVETEEKTYFSLKPDDQIEILWEFDIPDNPTVRYVRIMETDETFFPVWNNSKMFSWVLNNTDEL
jgi:hypothetical protein